MRGTDRGPDRRLGGQAGIRPGPTIRPVHLLDARGPGTRQVRAAAS